MTDIICPICGKPNPPDQAECLNCQAPLKAAGFILPAEGQGETSQPQPPSEGKDEAESQKPARGVPSPLEEAVPDWLKETEASFLEGSEPEPGEKEHDEVSEQIASLLSEPSTPENTAQGAINEDWLASLLAEAGASQPKSATPQKENLEQGAEGSEPGEIIPATEIEQHEAIEETELPAAPEPPQKPDWLAGLEAASPIKLEAQPVAPAPGEEAPSTEPAKEDEVPPQQEIPEWVKTPGFETSPPALSEPEPAIVPAELPGWLEALRPTEEAAPTEPIEDVSAADIVTAGPLVGLRGVISAHPSAIRARKPPTYSVKLKVTDEQRARVEMMEALLAEEQKPKPLPVQPIISSRHVFRLVIALLLIASVAWMIITKSQRTPAPQPGNIPSVIDFTQQVQLLPAGTPVLLAFDFEAGYSGELSTAITTLITQLMIRGSYMTVVSTSPSGPALAESLIKNIRTSASGTGPSTVYADLGYIPGGTMGLLALADSPKSVLPYSIVGENVWATAPLNTITSITDFSAVIVLTNDSDTARNWIEQVGPSLRSKNIPLLMITSSQAEPLIYPYYAASPSQVQGLVAGLAGGLAYSRTVGNIQNTGMWDAFSIGITVSILILLAGAIAGVIITTMAAEKKAEHQEK